MWETETSFTRKSDQSIFPTRLLQTGVKTNHSSFNAKYQWLPSTSRRTPAKINENFVNRVAHNRRAY